MNQLQTYRILLPIKDTIPWITFITTLYPSITFEGVEKEYEVESEKTEIYLMKKITLHTELKETLEKEYWCFFNQSIILNSISK